MLQLSKPEECFWVIILSFTDKEAQPETLQSLILWVKCVESVFASVDYLNCLMVVSFFTIPLLSL